MATAAAKTKAFTESCFCEAKMPVDREAGIIRGVKILGEHSQNGNQYTQQCMAESRQIYEGAKVNVNHPKGSPSTPRDYQDRLGVIRNVEHRKGDGLYGELHYNPKHAIAPQLEWDAEHNPSAVGFSHNVDGRFRRQGGKRIVEGIDKLRSVDLVADPATTAGLYEHVEGDDKTLAEVIESHAGSDSPILPLLEAFMSAAPTAGAMQVPAGKTPQLDSAMGAGAAPMNNALHDALKAAVVAVFDDATLDDAAMLDKIKKILGVKADQSPDAAAGDDPIGGDPFADDEETMTDEEKKAKAEAGEKKLKESVEAAVSAATKPLVEQVAAQQKQIDARAVLESVNATPTAQLIGELVACTDKPAMEKLVEGWSPAKLGRTKPQARGLGNFTEGVAEYPKDHDSFARALRR